MAGLYKAKRKDNTEWIEGYYAKVKHYFSGKEVDIIFPLDVESYPNCEFSRYEDIYPDTLCEHIRMSDKNGKPIFENDIVKTKYGRLCVVVFFQSQSHNCWDLKPINIQENLALPAGNMYRLMRPWREEDLEVVSNIHDMSIESLATLLGGN